MSIYYVYAYIRESDGTPYYIGKGKGNRAFSSYGRSFPIPNKDNIIFLHKNLAEKEAYYLEKKEISKFGRETLLNKTDGGGGISGYVFTKEQKENIKNSCNLIKNERKINFKIAAKTRNFDYLRIRNKGEKQRAAASKKKPGTALANIGNTNHMHDLKVKCPNCNKVGSYPIMQRWHFNNCRN
jgi:hypothetical protein